MNRKKFAIGVDVGGSHLCSAVIDLDRKVLCSAPVLTPMDSSGPAEEILACFKKNLLETMEVFGKKVNRAPSTMRRVFPIWTRSSRSSMG